MNKRKNSFSTENSTQPLELNYHANLWENIQINIMLSHKQIIR